MNVLVLNAGSASLKFDVVSARPGDASPDDGRGLLSGVVEPVGEGATLALLDGKARRREFRVDAPDYAAAAREVFRWLGGDGPPEGAPRLADVGAVAHRVVHGGDRFDGPAAVDADVLEAIASFGELAPLHNDAALAVIEASRGPSAGRPAVAVFDTAFFHALPERARAYALPRELSRKHRIRRYGFHGTSHRYLAGRYARLTGSPPGAVKLVTLHLEGGCSAAAIDGGRPVDTSMGFTPLEGLVMGTRSGDVDPGLVGYIARKEGVSVERVEAILNRESGLLGLSGASHDTRDLRRRGDGPAGFALEVFCYRIRKYVGAYLAALGGADAVVFGGGVGEDDPGVREAVCSGLGFCGLALDAARNRAALGVAAKISADGSRTHAYVIPTREALQIAHEAAALLGQRPAPSDPGGAATRARPPRSTR